MHVEVSGVPVGVAETLVTTIGPMPSPQPGSITPVVIRGVVAWTNGAAAGQITIRVRQGTGPSLAALPNLGPANGFVANAGSGNKGSNPFRCQDMIGSVSGYSITAQLPAAGTADFASVDMGSPL